MKLAKISTKIDEKWDKNKNNGFGLGPQFLIIKSTQIEWKSMKISWNLIIKSPILQWNPDPNLSQIQKKITENWPNSNQNWAQFLYYPLLKIERKSMKSDNKFTQNQWKSMKSLSKIHRKSAIF